MTDRSRRLLATLVRPLWLTDEVVTIYESGCPAGTSDAEWLSTLQTLAEAKAPIIPDFVATWEQCGYRVVPGKERDARALFIADALVSERMWSQDEVSGLFVPMGVRTEVTTVAGPTDAEIAAHVLQPGDCVWILDARAPDPLAAMPLGSGVIVRSPQNTVTELEVFCGGEPLLQAFPVTQLRWMGEM